MKKSLIVSATTLLALVYLSSAYKAELAVFLWILLGIGVFVLLVLIGFTVWFGSEQMKMIRAKRIDKEKHAHVMTIGGHGQFWVRDTDRRATWRSLHLEQRVYSNGHYAEPTESERLAWRIFNQKRPARALESPPIQALPEPTIDLLAALDNAQRTLIVGASNSGKTTLLQHIISRRRGQVIVIDPHSYPDKWPCQQVIGIGRDYEAIDDTLASLVRLMSKRYDEIGKGEVIEGQHPPVTIIIDEWRAIVQNVDNAGEAIKTLLTESRKAAMAVFVATHSERAKPLGLDGEYDLKDGFAIVRLAWENGQYSAAVDMGNGTQRATLPGPYIQPQAAIGEKRALSLPQASPDEIEQQILDLYDQGIPKTRISMEVFGSKGGHQSKKIQDVIWKYRGCKV